MADAPRSSPADVLSRFLATSPTLIQEKIRCVFDELKDVEMEGVFQFWAPVKTTGERWLLTTFDQPFVVSEDDSYGEQYRLCSERYQYNLDMDNSEYNIDRLCSVSYKYLRLSKYFLVEEDPTIINGAPSRAFLNRMPELLPDLRAHRMSPLESSALQCSMPRAVMLPVFDPSESCCVGVIEFSTTLCCVQLDVMLPSLHYELEKVGLKTFHAKPPYETVCGLANARDEINKALKIISPKFLLDLVQVWIAYKDEKHVAFSYSLEDCRTERMLGIKLLGHSDYDQSYESYDQFAQASIVGYSNICNMLPLKMGKGLIGKTLKNRKPRFIKKVSKLRDNQPLMMLRYHCIDGYPFECSCFVICLRSTETSDFDYVFEFLWHELPNYAILLESLLLSLKSCLPNFKYASGGELGDELPIIDVDDSTKENTKIFKIFKRNKSSSESEASEKMNSAVKTTPISSSQEGMIEAAKTLDVSLSTLKRKRKDRSDTNEEEKGAFQDSSDNREMYLEENTLTIKAECADDMIKFTLPFSSATFAAILGEIGKRFKLDPASYKLKYLDEDGDWILLTSDEDMKVCIKEGRNLTSIVRLRLLPRQPSDPSHSYQAT